MFISTREAVNPDGSSKNPTKSICDCYVFNTVITRAQSLVVAVGQPYYLFGIENCNSYQIKCWREYMKFCIVSNNLSSSNIPSEKVMKSPTEAVHKDLEQVYTDFGNCSYKSESNTVIHTFS